MSQILVGDDLHRSFGPTQALRGASIVLDEGEIVAVMGPSGSGKSTLLHCLAAILTPDRGEVHFDGRHRPAPRPGTDPPAAHGVRVRLPVRAARARAAGG